MSKLLSTYSKGPIDDDFAVWLAEQAQKSFYDCSSLMEQIRWAKNFLWNCAADMKRTSAFYLKMNHLVSEVVEMCHHQRIFKGTRNKAFIS
jgi:hypothetical protein